MSSLQSEIKGSSMIKDGWWRLLMFVDASDEEILDRTVEAFESTVEFNWSVDNVSSQ